MRLVTDLYEVSMAGSYLRREACRTWPRSVCSSARCRPTVDLWWPRGCSMPWTGPARFRSRPGDVSALAALLVRDESFVRPLTGRR
jgi:hypothetical protein